VLSFSHWQALVKKAKAGWIPTSEDVALVSEKLVGEFYPDQGFIGPHSYRLDEVLHDARIAGRGWCIFIGEAPSSKPQILVTDRRFKSNPILDPEFVAKAMPIVKWKAKQVRAKIARDWPRNSTMPDASGKAKHPLYGACAVDWTCYHCDANLTGWQLAKNLWHCTECGATPLDIFVNNGDLEAKKNF
jgi:hypothetical protein